MILGSGKLTEVFEIKGSGVVAVLESFEGKAVIGNLLEVAGNGFTITGIEMINFRDFKAAEKYKEVKSIGLLIDGIGKQTLDTFKGTNLNILGAPATK